MGQPSRIEDQDGFVFTGSDHAALAVMPVTVAAPQGDTTPWRYSYQVRVDEKVERYDVTLTPGGAGWPTHADQLVYLALLQLAVADGCEPILRFQRQRVFDLLPWSDDGGSQYERLSAALSRLTHLTVEVRSALVARNGRPYGGGHRGAHLIDAFEIGKGRDAACRVTWGELVTEAFALQDLKRLDWQLLKTLGNPLTVQLYRLLDRVVLSGQTQWEVGWRPLATALGMNADGYSRPARFRQVLEPHLGALIEQKVIDGYDYRRGGLFVFHVRNYLRAQVRRVLEQLGVYPEAARKLLAAHDEVPIMLQCDCLQHGSRGRPQEPGGYLVKAIQDAYELQYPDDEPEAFCGLWDMLGSDQERIGYHDAALRLCGARDSLFATREDPTAWPIELRAVARFMICHSIDAEEVNRSGTTDRIPRLP